MSDEAKASLQADIDAITKDLQRDSQDAQQDAQEEQQRLLNELGAKVMQVINKYANDNKITMVFDVTHGAQANNLLFASNSIDITRDIIALYDQLTANAVPSKAPAAAPAGGSAAIGRQHRLLRLHRSGSGSTGWLQVEKFRHKMGGNLKAREVAL